MRFLLYDWDALSQRGLVKALEKKGHEVIWYNKKIENHILDENFVKELAVAIATQKIDVVISFNFFSQVSLACQALKKIYVSWIYSCPHYYLESKTAFYEGNLIFVFDRAYANYFANKGFPNVFHLPLAVDPDEFKRPKGNRRFGYDVSFVGSLYANEKNYFEEIKGISQYWLGYVEAMCEAQTKVYGYDLIRANITKDMLLYFQNLIRFEAERDMTLSFEEFLVGMIQKKVTVLERSRYLKSLSEQFETALFTNTGEADAAKELTNVKLCGPVSYYDQMPEVFRQSKVNINITLRSITSGIPLRVLDVLGSGGFLLTNYQEEIAEYFENKKEVVMWSSEEELLDLCGYYLRHETERKDIAKAGFEKVCNRFSYDVQVNKILEIVEE